jgi:serine/threonine-protein kinase
MDEAFDRERWRRLSGILDAALDLPLEARGRYLDEACGGDAALRREADDLLAADFAAGNFLDSPAAERAAPLVAEMMARGDEAYAAPPGRLVGTYRLLDELGEGGMGTVYLAERADGEFEHRVAIKLLRHGLESRDARRRFLQERQILARLKHPAIARLLDGGVTEGGVPFFVMELVDGKPVTTFCEERQLGPGERLRVFIEICDAVQYAHRNLVVHRDIKPSNVLVDSAGNVKLLDFGIAKLLAEGGETAPAQPTRTLLQAMTLEYASPEQVRGDAVTTATDVYALGVLLYELLTGVRPHRTSEGARTELERAILDREPPRPSSISSRLRGDLDSVVLKALQKQPERRYASADALALDLRRFLQGLPVSARGETVAYRVRKFIGRHRLAVASASLVVLSLIAGLVGTIGQARRAQREVQKAEAVKDFLKSLFAASDPAEARGRERTALELLEDGATRIRTELKDQPEVQSEVTRLVADVYFQLGEYERALPLLRADLERRTELDGPRSVAVAESLNLIADVIYDGGGFDESAALYERALEIQREKDERSPQVADLLWDLGGVERNRGRLARAEELDKQSLAIFVETRGDDSAEAVAVRESLAIIYAQGERLREAAALQDRVAAWRERVSGPDHPHTLNARYNLATYLLALGRIEEAERIVADVVARQRRVMGGRHDRLAAALRILARTLDARGEAEAALPRIEEALSIHRERFGEDHLQVAIDLTWEGAIEAHTERIDEAVDHSRQAVLLTDLLKTATPRDRATAHLNAGMVLLEAGEPEEAGSELSQAVAVFSQTGSIPLLLGRALDAQSELARTRGEITRAVSLGREALSLLEGRAGTRHPAVALARARLGAALCADGNPGEGEPLLRAGIETLRRQFPNGHPDLAAASLLLGSALAESGRAAEARPLLEAALAWREAHFGPKDARTLAVQRVLAHVP